MPIIDQLRDPVLATLVNLVQDRPGLEELVKEAEVNMEELNALPDEAFAWSEKRAWPLHTREHAAMSRAYREASVGRVPPYVDEAIKQACEAYAIPEAIFARPKVASHVDDPQDYLLPDLKRLPVRNAEQVKVAEEKLRDGYQKLTVEHRAMACSRLLEKAAAFGVRLDPLMHQLAGFTVSSTKVLGDWVEARKEASADEYKSAFQQLADGLRGTAPESRDRASLVKVAEVITELDKKAGLTKFYGKKLPDPMLSVFNTQKIAGQGVDLNGKFMSMQRLASYPASFYGDVLGDDLVREASDKSGELDVQKLAAILETLPRDMKSMLAANMRA